MVTYRCTRSECGFDVLSVPEVYQTGSGKTSIVCPRCQKHSLERVLLTGRNIKSDKV